MSDKARKKGAPRLQYSFRQRKKNGTFDIINSMSEYVILVWMKNSRINMNYAVSVGGYWITDSNFENGLILNKAYLDLMFSCTNDKYAIAEFEEFFHTVRFINPKGKINNKTK